jgi:hypothetical protein
MHLIQRDNAKRPWSKGEGCAIASVLYNHGGWIGKMAAHTVSMYSTIVPYSNLTDITTYKLTKMDGIICTIELAWQFKLIYRKKEGPESAILKIYGLAVSLTNTILCVTA